MINKEIRERSNRAFQSGDTLEKRLISQFRAYKKFSLAYIDKNTGSSVASKLEMMYFNRTFERKLRVDFIGYAKAYMGKKLDKSSFVAIEAKHCTRGGYMPFSMIKPHQLEYLHNIYNLGGISFFIIGFPKQKQTIRLWANSNVYDVIKRTTSSDGCFGGGINIDDLISCVGPNNVFDYEYTDVLNVNNLMI